MNYFFVTGSSKGLGKAIVEELLKETSNKVIGISRDLTISNPRYTHISMDLSLFELVNAFRFQKLDNPSSVCLINNAGIIGEIQPVGAKKNSSILKTFQVNTIAPSLLINSFIKQYQNISCKKTIFNISSGAGRHTINSWADYCASKSALDMFSMVVFEEQKSKKFPFTIFSVAPGVIDTEMQKEIRATSKNNFSQLEYFKNLKTSGQLSSPKEISRKIIEIIEHSYKYKNVLLDVRNV